MKSFMMFAACLTAVSVAPAQQPTSATFYMMIGQDTIIVERATRTASRLQFQMFDAARHGRVDFDAAIDPPTATVIGARIGFFTSDRDTVPVRQINARFTPDSVALETGGVTNWLHLGHPALPFVNPSPTMLEQTVMRARVIGGDSASFSYLFMPSGPEVPVTVIWKGTDSAIVRFASVAIRLAVSRDGKLLGGSIPTQKVTIVRGGGTSGEAPAHKSYAPPPGAPYTAEEVVVHTKSGLVLTGTLTLPPMTSGKTVPAVVTITGSGSQDRDESGTGIAKYRLYYQVADTLGRRGIAVLRLDDRGINGSSTGPLTVTTLDFADDIRAGVAYLRTRSEIDHQRIALIGHSEGGYIAPMIAASDSQIAGIIILGGSVSPGRSLLTFQQEFVVDSMAHLVGQQRDAALAQYRRNTDSVAAITPWMKFFLDYDGTATAARVHAPVLILHGERDYQVPVREAAKMAAAIKSGGNRDVTIRVFPATNHLFVDDAGVGFAYEKLTSFAVRPEALGAIADWLVTRLKP